MLGRAMKKQKSPNTSKEIGRFTPTWDKGKRAKGIEVVITISDDPVSMEQVTREYAKIMAPVFLELMAKDREAEALAASASDKKQ
jgi:hypothetical protein